MARTPKTNRRPSITGRRTELNRRVKEGAVRRAERDKLLVAEWSHLDRSATRWDSGARARP